MERKPDWLPGFPVQIYCNRSYNDEKEGVIYGFDDVYDYGNSRICIGAAH